MDIEGRLQKIEAQVHQIKILVWIVLALVLAIGLGFLLVAVKLGLLLPVRWLVVYGELILVAFVLIAVVCLLVFYPLASVISGLRQFWTSREADAQVFRQAIAERTEDRGQDSGL
jgi:CBS domain containing-hemolysin-like protein